MEGQETEAPPPQDGEGLVARGRKSHSAPALIALDRIDDDPTFQLRAEGDLSLLATDIARLGQLFPVDLRLRPPDRFQVICGFRRVGALKFLQRDRVLARLHTDLSDEDALLMSLAAAIHGQAVDADTLGEVRDRLESEGRLDAAARDMLEKALTPPQDALAPEEAPDSSGSGSGAGSGTAAETEIDADELARDVTQRLGAINQDLSLLADVFAALDDERRVALLEQLRYSSELVTYLESR